MLKQDRLDPLHHPRGLHGMAGGADVEQVVGRGDVELLEEDVGEELVVVLAGMDERC